MAITLNPDLLEAAKKLAADNRRFEPKIQKIYLFPDDAEIRLVEVDPTTLPSESVSPYYFRADTGGEIPFPVAIALITPEEDGQLDLPTGWGSWKEAITL